MVIRENAFDDIKRQIENYGQSSYNKNNRNNRNNRRNNIIISIPDIDFKIFKI